MAQQATAPEKNGMHGEVYFPAPEIVESAHISDYDKVAGQARGDLAEFWGKIASENFEWYEPWEKVLEDEDAPFYKWFVGAKVNIVHNALDRHMRSATRNKAALIFEGEPGDVYDLKPLKLLVLGALAVVHHQLVVEHLLLVGRTQVVEVLRVAADEQSVFFSR